MTNVLIVLGHPDSAGAHLCHAIADTYKRSAEENGHHVALIEIAQEDIPYLRSFAEWESKDMPPVAVTGQAAIDKADHIVLIYPLWKGDLPALLKSWLEQVLRRGFAFEKDRSSWRAALNGKSARVIVTMGMPGFVYRWFFLAHSLRSLDRNILKFCGVKPVRWSIFGNAEDSNGRVQKGFLAKAAQLGRATR